MDSAFLSSIQCIQIIKPCFVAEAGADIDYTQSLQRAIDQLSYGDTLDGKNKQYTVTSLYLKSGITLINFFFVTKSGSKDFVSPITILGTQSIKTDITLINIKINGNRQNQINILTPQEDGGRSGFRIIGNVKNLKIINCEANFCATDGLILFSSGMAKHDDSYFTFNNIIIQNFKAKYNRRHGISLDCAKDIYIDNAILAYNGKDLNSYSSQTNGNKGARFRGMLYGNGMDIEGYGIGTAINDIRINHMQATRNAAAGLVITDPTNPITAKFKERDGIFISNSTFDMGDNSAGIGAALDISSSAAVSPNGYTYNNVQITNTVIQGRLYLRGIKNAKIDIISYYNDSDYATQTVDCQNINITSKVLGRAKKNYSYNSNAINFVIQ